MGWAMGRTRNVVAALGIGAAFAMVPAIAAAAPNGAQHPVPPQATLVRTDIFRPGPPARDAAGKATSTVTNCSPDDPSQYLSTPAYTGFTSTISDRTAHFNAATKPAALTTATSDIQAAFNTWVAENPKAPPFTVTTAAPVVTSATANRHTDVLFGRAPGNAIAVTYTWRWSDTGQYESDTVFNKRVPWAEIPTTGVGADGCNETVVAYDLQNIATHELGHIYGLGHPAGDRFATMYAYGYTGETLKRSLATSDQIGIDALYH